MTLAPVAAAPLAASGPSDQVSNPMDHAVGDALDAQLQADQGDATGIAGDVQLSDARTTFHGEATNDSLGETVVGIGDVTGDGTDDVALGAPEAADGAGAVYHFFGPVAEGDLNASEDDLTVTGAESGDWAGADVAAADLTGDGMRDLVIGAPQANDGTGAVYVFYGADLLAAVEGGASEVSVADASVTMTGESEGDWFGMALAANGHENAGDDSPMLAVGAPGADGDAGAVYTFSDVSSDATAADADAVVSGPAQGDQAGWSLAMADNYTDAGEAALVVGAPQHDGTGAVGILTDVSGDASLADADRLLLGEGDGDRAGWAVDEAGDVDDDGLTDVVIGAPLNDETGEDAGAAYVVRASSHQAGSMSLADADAIVRGEQAGDTAGYDVSAAGSGDVTCDEYDDVLVGAPGHDADGQQDAGAAYIVAGGDTLEGDSSLADAQAKLHGESAGDLAGFSVADAMDVTDNGDEDVLVGAPGANENAGAAYLVEGECPGEEVAEEPAEEEPKEEEPAEEEPKEEEPVEEELASLNLTLECQDDGNVTATFTNPNDENVTVTAEYEGEEFAQFDVEADDSLTLTDLPDGAWSFSAVTASDETVQINDEDVFSATIDCDEEEAVVEEPTEEEPVEEEPKEEEPVEEEPKEEEPVEEEPKEEEPVEEEPKEEEPVEEEPAELESLSLTVECADDGTVTATFINPNDENVTVSAELNGSALDTIEVGAGETLTLDGLPDGDWAFSAETDGGETVQINGKDVFSASIDCEEPKEPPADDLESLTLDLQCDEDGNVTATFTNPNDENVTVSAEYEGGAFATIEVGSDDTLTVDDLPDGAWAFSAMTEQGDRVLINGEERFTATINCEPKKPPADDLESLTLDLVCDENGNVTATINNPNDVNVTVIAEHNQSSYDQIEIGANDSITLTELPDGYWAFSATADGETVQINDEDVYTESIDCDEPVVDLESLTLDLVCDENGTVTATIENPNNATVSVVAELNGSAYDTFDVGANDSVTLTGLQDGDWAFSATADGETVQINDEDVYTETIDCEDGDEVVTDYRGCSQVIISGLEEGDEVTVVAIDNDGDTQEFTTTASGTTLSVTTDEFGDLDEPKIYQVYVNGDLVSENTNVEQNSQGNYTCAGAGNGQDGDDGDDGNDGEDGETALIEPVL